MPDLSAAEMDESVEECIAKATAYKSSGNDAYKSSDFDKAIELYENGVNSLKKIHNLSASHNQLLSILYSNICAAYLESSNYVKAKDYANNAIDSDPNNKKAYYRRAQAYFNTGMYDEALADCNYLIKTDQHDSNVNLLLHRINEKLRQIKLQQKKAFGGLFSKVGGLYEDRQLEIQKKKQKKYEDYTREKREKNEVEMDFETWEKYELEEEAKKEQERSNKAKTESEKLTNPSGPVEIDDEDEKIISETKKMGYCYFNKNVNDIKNNLNASGTSNSTRILTEETKDGDSVKRSISSWNSKGTTYEEKDMTSWCKKTLEGYLMQAKYENTPMNNGDTNIIEMFNDINLDKKDGLLNLQKLASMIYKSSIKVTSIESLEGDAQIAFIRGTRRYLFDFSCNLNAEITIDTSVGTSEPSSITDEPHISNYSCIVALKEISSEKEAGKTWKDYMCIKYPSTVKPELVHLINDMLEKYKDIISNKIDQFLTEYRMQ